MYVIYEITAVKFFTSSDMYLGLRLGLTCPEPSIFAHSVLQELVVWGQVDPVICSSFEVIMGFYSMLYTYF